MDVRVNLLCVSIDRIPGGARTARGIGHRARGTVNSNQMTKQQLVDRIATASEQSRKDIEAVVEAMLAEIGKALRSGERVDLRGFGSFVVNDKKARQGRNPKTGEPIQIAARKAAAFKASKELTASLASAELETSA